MNRNFPRPPRQVRQKRRVRAAVKLPRLRRSPTPGKRRDNMNARKKRLYAAARRRQLGGARRARTVPRRSARSRRGAGCDRKRPGPLRHQRREEHHHRDEGCCAGHEYECHSHPILGDANGRRAVLDVGGLHRRTRSQGSSISVFRFRASVSLIRSASASSWVS